MQVWQRAHFEGSVKTFGDLASHVIAASGQIPMHAPHSKQRPRRYNNTGLSGWLSGLWHHRHESGQPLKKTVVRMPGPSLMEYFFRSKIVPVCTNTIYLRRDCLSTQD